MPKPVLDAIPAASDAAEAYSRELLVDENIVNSNSSLIDAWDGAALINPQLVFATET